MLKKLVPYIGEFKKETILSPVCIAIEVIMEVILPMLMAQVIDFGVNVGDMNYVLNGIFNVGGSIYIIGRRSFMR